MLFRSISGETIDYGPCAFLDHYDPAQVFSSIDEMGRYAYANQPRIALWNLTRFAECLLALLADNKEKAIEQAQFILGEFPERFTAAYQAGLRRKTGLFTERDGDEAMLSVQDDGPGVAPDRLDRIFDRYYTYRPADVACSAEVSGAHFGIGLWLARQNTIALGGKIGASNRDPHGLRVTVVLPLAKG